MVRWLRDQGLDVVDSKESGWQGAHDVELIRLSVQQRRIILTHDRDFGKLAIAAREQVTGIMYLRPGHLDPERTIADLNALLLHNPDVDVPCVIVVQRRLNGTQIRIRTW